MHRKLAALVACILLLVFSAGCAAEEKTYQDGVYSAEFLNFDSYGYKDFLRVTVQDGVVTELLFDGLNEAGELKSVDERYADNMESVQQTYPQKYIADLTNQMLGEQNIDRVDTIAGATYSSDCFNALFKALTENMQGGVTDMVYIENVPVK